MKKNLKIVWNVIQVFILFYVFLITFLVININEYGYSELFKSTYVPINKKVKKHLDKYNSGDLLIIKSKDIKKDDIIYYYTIESSNYFVTSSKVKEIKDGIYTTEDNFDIEQDRVVGNKVTRIKFIGFILGFLIKEIGYFCFIILPMLLILIYHIYDFSKNMRQLNKIRIDNIKRFYNDNDVKNKEFNDSIKKIVEEIEVLDDLDNNKKEEIEILDF